MEVGPWRRYANRGEGNPECSVDRRAWCASDKWAHGHQEHENSRENNSQENRADGPELGGGRGEDDVRTGQRANGMDAYRFDRHTKKRTLGQEEDCPLPFQSCHSSECRIWRQHLCALQQQGSVGVLAFNIKGAASGSGPNAKNALCP